MGTCAGLTPIASSTTRMLSPPRPADSPPLNARGCDSESRIAPHPRLGDETASVRLYVGWTRSVQYAGQTHAQRARFAASRRRRPGAARAEAERISRHPSQLCIRPLRRSADHWPACRAELHRSRKRNLRDPDHYCGRPGQDLVGAVGTTTRFLVNCWPRASEGVGRPALSRGGRPLGSSRDG